MYNIISVEFLFLLLYSFAATILAVFIPGNVVLRLTAIKFPPVVLFALSFVVGAAFWVSQGFVFGFLHIRFLTYLYILAMVIISIRQLRGVKIRLLPEKKLLLPLIIIAIGSLMQISFGILTGVLGPKGISLCCVDVSDNLYFLALSSEIVKNIPPFEPGLYGVIVKNYHYLSNIFTAELSRVFVIPLNILQYQFSSIYLPVMLGLTVLSFGLTVTKKIRYSLWLLFFIYFGGDFIWLLMVILQKGTNYFSMGSLEDGTKFLSNPPRAFALVQFFGGLSLLQYWLLNKKNFLLIFLIGIVIGTLIGFKVYVGIFALLGVGVLSLFWIVKREFKNLLLSASCFLVALIFYLPVNSGAGGLYFTSFWFFENFIVQPYLQLERLELARRVFLDDNKYFKAFFFEILYFCIVVFSLFGTKLIGLIQSRKTIHMFLPELHVFLIAGIIPSLIVGFFFQQTSGGSNTFNFTVNVFIVGSIYTAATAFWLTSFNKKISVTVALVIIGLTIPRVVQETKLNIERLLNHKAELITTNQYNAFNFLKTQKKGLTLIDHKYFILDQKSPYIHYFSQQPMYLSGTQILASHGVATDEKEAIQSQILTGTTSEAVLAIKKSNISYIILGKSAGIASTESAQFLDTIYKNKEVKILKVNSQKIDRIINKNE